MKRLAALFALGALVSAPAVVIGQVSSSKPILEIVTRLENEGYGPITEVSFEHGRWEVELYKDSTAYKLVIDPATWKTLAQEPNDGDRRPPANAKKLSAILRDLDTRGYQQIDDVSFEGSRWEVEARRDGSKRKLRIDPISGKIASDRADH